MEIAGEPGSELLSARFDERKLSLSFTVVGSSRTHMRQLLDAAFAVLSPTLSGDLLLDTPLGERKLSVRPNQTPALRMHNECCAGVSVGLTAFSPLFSEPQERRVEMASAVGGLEFPLELNAGWEIGQRLQHRMVNVYNPGQVACGMRMVLSATGAVHQPYLMRLGSAERLMLERDLAAGDRLEIQSFPSRKRVELVRGQQRWNAIGSLSPDSRFPSLQAGDNLLVCGAAFGERHLLVTVYFQPYYTA